MFLCVLARSRINAAGLFGNYPVDGIAAQRESIAPCCRDLPGIMMLHPVDGIAAQRKSIAPCCRYLPGIIMLYPVDGIAAQRESIAPCCIYAYIYAHTYACTRIRTRAYVRTHARTYTRICVCYRLAEKSPIFLQFSKPGMAFAFLLIRYSLSEKLEIYIY